MCSSDLAVQVIDGLANESTLVSLDIADPLFLVENEKLTLSGSVSAKGRNSDFRGFHGCETHASCIIGRGRGPELRESQGCGTLTLKLGLDVSGAGVKLVRGTPFAGLPLEVA